MVRVCHLDFTLKNRATTSNHQGNNMESDRKIAKISLEPKTYRIKNITFYIHNMRFKCRHCATFCCKLGGPTLSARDIERLKEAGHCETEFLNAQGGLKNRASGSCVFLRFDAERDIYKCSVYHHRPALCRVYPFCFEKTSRDTLSLEIMPCRGLSRRSGELVDEKFILTHLIDALHDLSEKSY
jgi:Fe-S-cluster containining protein